MEEENIQQNGKLTPEEAIDKEIRAKKEKAKENPILASLLQRKKKKRLKKSIWVTWLAKIMAGELSCYWEPWFKANFTNYKKMPESIELAKWQIEHSRLLYELRKERLVAGEKLFVESSARFSHQVSPNVFLEGVPDLIAVSDNDVTIYDCKTGEQKTSHQIQVMIYMYYILHYQDKFPGLNPRGRVRYSNGMETEISDSLVDEKFIKDLDYFIKILEGDKSPMKAPSKFECQYCNITKDDCPERID